jgi:hypothetical protein
MLPVAVRILHAEGAPEAGPLERVLVAARADMAERHRRGFLAAGASDVRVVAGLPDGISFGARLRGLAAETVRSGATGLVVLGSGALPMATARDRRVFVVAAGRPSPAALANNVYSADIVAVSGPALLRTLGDLPDLPADNALPRWLAEVAGVPVIGLDRWRLGIDLDSPLDVFLMGRTADALRLQAAGIEIDAVMERLARLRAILADRRAELVVAGRTSARTLRALERGAACRVRALVEERGLRAASTLAFAAAERGAGVGADERSAGVATGGGFAAAERSAGLAVAGAGGAGEPAGDRGAGLAAAVPRPPRSTLGLLVDRDGPAALGGLLAELGDGAVIDTRVLMAHRWGPDEAAWPPAEDRFAGDLLLPDRIADPWLRALIAGLRDAPIPVVCGGHTLVGPGLRLLVVRAPGSGVGGPAWRARPPSSVARAPVSGLRTP